MDLLYTFSDNTNYTSDFVTAGAKLVECYHNNLNAVDNSLSVKVPFDEVLCDKLKTDISNNIKVQLRDDEHNNLFTGYVRKTLTFTKTQRNQPFSLEIVPPSFLFDKDYSGNSIRLENTTIKNVIITLAGYTEFCGQVNVSQMGNESMAIFTLEEGENILSVLKELCFEYCYVFNFDSNGNLVVEPLFVTVPSTITQHFDGENCLNQIQQQVKETSYSQVAVNWTKVERKSDVLIFEDTTGATESNAANIEIGANSYYLGEEHNYLEYDSKYQGILWITSATPEITYDDSSSITSSFVNYGVQGDLSIFNSANVSRYITKLVIKGSGYFEIATNTNKTGSTTGTLKEVNASYIQSTEYASILAKALKDYYAYANFTLTLQSKTKYNIGSYCDVSDRGMGTVICRIIKRAWNIQTNSYDYTLESISAYDPAETVTTKSNSRSKNDNGETLRSAVATLNDKVDTIVTDTTICSADVTQAIIEVDEKGLSIAAQDISTTIRLQQSDIDLTFAIGTIPLPAGWSYTRSGNTVTFHIGEGVSISSGQFYIPVIYRPIIAENNYIDESAEEYADENGNTYKEQIFSDSYTTWKLYFTYFANAGGIYLGVIDSIANIPSVLNYGDYFTWGGENTTTSLSYEGQFKKSSIYTYVGTDKAWQWEKDLSVEHCSIALGDILGIANTDLAQNNSTAYEFVDHLTANSIFTDLLVANNAYINALTSRIISVGSLISSSELDTAITDVTDELTADIATAKAEAISQAKTDVYAATGIDTLSSYTLIQDGYIKTGLIDVDAIKTTVLTAANIQAISGVFDNITVNGIINAKGGEFTGVEYINGVLKLSGINLLKDGIEMYTMAQASGRIKLLTQSTIVEWIQARSSYIAGFLPITGTRDDLQYERINGQLLVTYPNSSGVHQIMLNVVCVCHVWENGVPRDDLITIYGFNFGMYKLVFEVGDRSDLYFVSPNAAGSYIINSTTTLLGSNCTFELILW